MKPRLFFTPLACALSALIVYLAVATAAPEQPQEPETVPWPVPDIRIVDSEYRGRTAREWFIRYQQMRRYVTRRWMPTVNYALRLASAVSGVSYWELRSVSWCESRHWPFARNGIYRGLFQEGPMFEHGPFASFSVFDPIANALTAAHVVSREGWRQWQCHP